MQVSHSPLLSRNNINIPSPPLPHRVVTVLQSGLLGVNSLLILNRRRFLAKYELDDLQHAHASGNPMKVQAVGLLHAVQYLKVRL